MCPMFLISQAFTLGDRMVNKRLIFKQLGQSCSLYPRPLNRSTDSSCRSWNSSAEKLCNQSGEDADEHSFWRIKAKGTGEVPISSHNTTLSNFQEASAATWHFRYEAQLF